MKRFPSYRQLDVNDCGPTCLRMICFYYGKKHSLRVIRKICNVTRLGVTVHDILTGAKELGFSTSAVKIPLTDLQHMPLPAILYWKQEHFVVLYNITQKKKKNIYHIVDPGFGKIKLDEDSFSEAFLGTNDSGIAIVLEPNHSFFEKENTKLSIFKELHEIFTVVKSSMKKHNAKFLLALCLALFAMVANWTIPIIFQHIIDDGIIGENMNIINILAISQFVIFVSYIISNNFSNIILSKIGYGLGITFLSNYLHKLIKLPIKFFDTKANSDLIQLVDDQDNLKSFMTYDLISFLFSFSNLIVFSSIVIYYNYIVFLVFLVFAILSLIWSSLFFEKRKILNYRRFSVASESKSNIYELVMGMREIKINNAQDNKISQVEKIQNKINLINLKALYLNYYNNTGVLSLNKLKDILIILFCAHFVILNQMTLGVLMSISYLLGQLSDPFNQILNFFQEVQDAKLSFERLSEIQKVANEDNDCTNIPPQNIINGFKLTNLYFKYEGSFNSYALKNINMNIPKGKITAVVGASGSGKTTLIKLLLKFYDPQKGYVYLDDKEMANINSEEWRKKCGVVMQDGYLFSGTIVENIAVADEEPNIKRVDMAVKIAGVDTFIEQLPMGYNTKIGNVGIDLSGGQKQRLLIARAVYKDPEFIFFDEATSFLDATNELIIMNNLTEFYQGKTVVVVAHRLSTVKNADQIIVLDNGNIVEQGNHESLTRMKGKYYELVKNQLELGN